MKKYRDHDFWYGITTGPIQGGQHIRYYFLDCCECGRRVTNRATGLTNEKMRKYFLRLEWDVGKNTTSHRCPSCKVKRPGVKPAQQQPKQWHEAKAVSLELAWRVASEEERQEFMKARMSPAEPPPIINDEVNEPPAEWWIELNKESGNN